MTRFAPGTPEIVDRAFRRFFEEWYLYPLIIVMAQVVSMPPGVIFRTMFGQAYKIPAGSMQGTLLVGDRILVSTSACACMLSTAYVRLFTARCPTGMRGLVMEGRMVEAA